LFPVVLFSRDERVLSVCHRGERLAYDETVEFVCSGGEPGAFGRGERDRHRVVVFGVVGKEMIVVGCE
jgi:hypothetical protein